MVIITERKKALPEGGGVVKAFTVNYWGVKVTYEIRQTPTGIIYYSSDDAHKAAKFLAAKAEEIFLKAQANAGLAPKRSGGCTAAGFIPTNTTLS